MVSSIGSYSSASAAFNRPDPSQMASKLFSKLDTKGQGYIEESDLQSAFSQVFSATGSSTASSDASSLFSALDSDSNGQVTESEFSSSVQKLAEALDNQAFGSRMAGGMGGAGGMGAMGAMGGMPPPPPPQEDDGGFTKDELSSQLEEIGSTDTERSSLISSVVDNFEAADANGDGKVSRAEAMAYQQSSSASTSSATSTSTSTSSSASGSSTDKLSTTAHSDARMMHRLMELMRAYGTEADSAGSSVAVSA
ncbi:MAG: EF-hand domain-containing protein [Zoogloea sp.]|nr:EF-hand domain-containing protein [Zoogloea sp.]MCA0184545.1 EF-hand domain-containing protein [Pseudomonadota bacterium]